MYKYVIALCVVVSIGCGAEVTGGEAVTTTSAHGDIVLDEPQVTGPDGGVPSGPSGDMDVPDEPAGPSEQEMDEASGGTAGDPEKEDPSEAGNDGGLPCAPEIEMTYVSHGVATVHPGSDDVPTYIFLLTAHCSDLEVTTMDFHISAVDAESAEDATPYRHGAEADANGWNFRDIKVKDVPTGAVVAGPLDHPVPYTSNEPAHLRFIDTFALTEGVPRMLQVTTDVSDSFRGQSEETRYTVTHNMVNTKEAAFFTMTYPQGFANPWPSFTVKVAQWGSFSFSGESPSEGCVTTGQFAHDYEAPLSGMLIKGSQPMVYYYGSDAKRYVFPTRTELVSWYDWHEEDPTIKRPDICRNVREFPDDVLATVPIGGNVTVRPGTYLVRNASGSEVLVVGRYQLLHRTDEGVLHKLFPNAIDRVYTVADAFFVNYGGGLNITNASQYDPHVEYDWGAPASTLEYELGILP
jgi:hypothetical protein